MIREHHVTVTVSIEDATPWFIVQQCVLRGVLKEFEQVRVGPTSVAGFDRAGLEKRLADMQAERDEWREGYLELRRRLDSLPHVVSSVALPEKEGKP